ncbi:MAG: hypothetical protein QOE61_4576, partial [Micromonosporaceae bacterium]|nr:hypothetical protein [Micromonosporaceae bacterium]
GRRLDPHPHRRPTHPHESRRLPRAGRPIQTVLITDCAIRLDTTRIYREAYERAGIADGLFTQTQAEREADAEFTDETDGGDV